MRFIFFTLVLTAILAEANVKVWQNFPLFQQAVTNFVFPKDPNIVRVRNLEQAKAIKKVTTLDFVSISFVLSPILLEKQQHYDRIEVTITIFYNLSFINSIIINKTK